MDSTIIKLVINTLNHVEVRGKENLDALLGCINALESVVKSMDAIPTENNNEQEAETHG